MDSTALALTLAGFGVLLIALSYQRHLHRRTTSALAHGIGGALVFLSGALLLALTLNFNTYDELKPDQPLAELSVEQTGPQTFGLRLMRIPAGDLQVFSLKGKRWQLEARVLRWQGWPTWLGLNANIRLEQLDVLGDRNNLLTNSASSYQLNRTPGIKLVQLQQAYPDTLDFLSSTQLLSDAFPLQDGLRFHIYYSDGKLLARAINRPRVVKRGTSSPVINYRGAAREAANSATSTNNDNLSDVAEDADEDVDNETGAPADASP